METNSSKISLIKSLIPITILISLLFYNIIFFENNDWLGEFTYHYILISTSIIATIIGLSEKIKISFVIERIFSSIKSISIPIVILLLVGALAGTWKVSGIIPAMVYYGLNLDHKHLPEIKFYNCYRWIGRVSFLVPDGSDPQDPQKTSNSRPPERTQ